MDILERMWRKVLVAPTGCWVWCGAIDRYGYGQQGKGKASHKAHRLMYTELVGPIPSGLQIDHLCRVRSCVNPAHMEPVTCRTNLLRGATKAAAHAARGHCQRGHEYTAENTYRRRDARVCRTCERERKKGNARSQARAKEH